MDSQPRLAACWWQPLAIPFCYNDIAVSRMGEK